MRRLRTERRDIGRRAGQRSLQRGIVDFGIMAQRHNRAAAIGRNRPSPPRRASDHQASRPETAPPSKTAHAGRMKVTSMPIESAMADKAAAISTAPTISKRLGRQVAVYEKALNLQHLAIRLVPVSRSVPISNVSPAACASMIAPNSLPGKRSGETGCTSTTISPPQGRPTLPRRTRRQRHSGEPQSCYQQSPIGCDVADTSPSTQPPDTDPTKRPSACTSICVPVGHGADFQVSTTVANRHRRARASP